MRLATRLGELLQHRRVPLEELREVREARDGGGAEMMLDALDVRLLRRRVETEEREEPRERGVALLDALGYGAAFIREDESAILFVVEVALLGELLHHARDAGLLDLQR